MDYGLTIHESATLELLCLGAFVHRLDRIIPFRKARECRNPCQETGEVDVSEDDALEEILDRASAVYGLW